MTNVQHHTSTCKTFQELLEAPFDVKLHMLQHHIHLSQLLIHELLEEAVQDFVGERYSHEKPHEGRYHRWGSNPGSVRVGDEKVRLQIPRLYDTVTEQSVP